MILTIIGLIISTILFIIGIFNSKKAGAIISLLMAITNISAIYFLTR